MTLPDAIWEFRVGASRSLSSAVENLLWHGFGKILGDERGIDDGKYGMDEGQGRPNITRTTAITGLGRRRTAAQTNLTVTPLGSFGSSPMQRKTF